MINSVRNTVLSVLNKNNYGYISPSDFNLYAKQAQMEMYEEYFSSYNKSINAENSRLSGTDYADIRKTLAEFLEIFITTKYLSSVIAPTGVFVNQYFMPSLTTTGDEAYMINKILCYTSEITSGTNSAVLSFSLVDGTATFVTDGISFGDIVVNTITGASSSVTSVAGQTTLTLDANIFTASPQTYRIYSASSVSHAEKVSNGMITLLNNSLLTTPSNEFPAYIQTGDIMKIYPTTINKYGQVQAIYFRYPKDPKWTFITLTNGEPAFDQSQPDYQDFELPLEDEFKLVMKILQYCGISIRELDVAQFGIAQEQHEQPTFSQQQ
jgi:hypothetical protein